MKNLPLLIITIVGTLALIIGVAVVFSQSNTSTQTADRTLLESNARNVMGPADAKVTVVEFSDFECPACAATSPLVNQLIAQYPNDVRVIYRHFPLVDIHPYAMLAAQASEVAAEQGKFWEMHDLLFENQSTWAAQTSAEAVQTTFNGYFTQLAIDNQLVMEKIQSDAVKQSVALDMGLGTQLNVNSTPTLYVNGQKLTAPGQLLPTVSDLLK